MMNSVKWVNSGLAPRREFGEMSEFGEMGEMSEMYEIVNSVKWVKSGFRYAKISGS